MHLKFKISIRLKKKNNHLEICRSADHGEVKVEDKVIKSFLFFYFYLIIKVPVALSDQILTKQ